MAKKPLRLVTVIEPDGTTTVTQEPNPNYDKLSKAVGGYIQEIPEFKKYNGIRVNVAYCNEEGKLTGQLYNRLATVAWRAYLDSTKQPYSIGMSILVGPVIIIQSLPKTKDGI